MQIFALIGASGSGKSALGLELAARYDGEIFSLDSLSIYRHIDIASAKPSQEERARIVHYGIDELEPSEPCSVMNFKHAPRAKRAFSSWEVRASISKA